MKAVGIIAEYNPFHLGHAYQIHAAKKESGADLVIVCMSGNFVQRGEPAILDKWKRARHAIESGADLIVEMPFKYVVQPAHIFAQAGVEILSGLACDSLSFGRESGDLSDFQKMAQYFLDQEKDLETALQISSDQAQSYPSKVGRFIDLVKMEENLKLDFKSPNNLLGLFYTKANLQLDHPMKLYPILRESGQHRDEKIDSQEKYASGTAIRQVLIYQNANLVKSYLPNNSFEDLKKSSLQSWEKAWPYLRYQISSQSLENLRNIYQMTEGLENLLKKWLGEADSFQDFMEKIKNKRYTWTRLQRLLTYVLVQVREEEMQLEFRKSPSSVRLLAFSEKGQFYLSQIRKMKKLDLLTRLGRDSRNDFALDIRAGEVYNCLHSDRANHQDFARKPIQRNNNRSYN